MKRPAFQFYPADWRKDAALQSCSLLARGLWIELICVMHECDQYGHLSINGTGMLPTQIARLVGESEKTVKILLKELLNAGVFSVTTEGCIFSRRMVKDERLRNVRSEAGRLGGNPNLLNQKDKQTVKQPDNQDVIHPVILGDKQSPTPSSSSSSSSTNLKSNAMSGKPDDDPLEPETPPPPKPKNENRELNETARKILQFLNTKTNRDYRAVPSNLNLIVARLKSGVTREQMHYVIARKCREWGADEKMSKYLRPETLFNATKFEQYLGEIAPEPLEAAS